jgi:hypothetical protein
MRAGLVWRLRAKSRTYQRLDRLPSVNISGRWYDSLYCRNLSVLSAVSLPISLSPDM